jgi:RNA polymerase sigma-70 factor (ECF subfamily)
MTDPRAARLHTLVRTYFSDVWCLLRYFGVRRARVEDATQEVFLVATARIAEIAEGNERAFLFGTARRVAQNERRRQYGRETPGDDLDTKRAAGPNPEEVLRAKETHALFLALLDKLDHDLREAFVLYEVEGLTVPEVAAVLGVPTGTAASRLRRAREEFGAHLERHLKRWGGKP